MRPFHLPDGLPSGQFLPPASPSLWQSDAPVAEPVGLWARCQQREEVTGLRPGHCCVGRSRMAGDWSGDCTSPDLCLRRLPVPA